MSSLDLDEAEQRQFDHTASGYGAVICGGDATERVEALQNAIEDPTVIIDGRFVETVNDFCKRVLLQTTEKTESDIESMFSLSSIDVSRGLGSTGANLLIYEFDSMEAEVQKGVAQMLKGVAERDEWDGKIGFTCEACDAIVRAEPDLSMRVRSWSLNS